MASRSATSEADLGLYYVFVEEVLQRGTPEAAEKFLASDFVEHCAGGERRRRAFIEHLAARRTRFAGAEWTIEVLTGVGGLVVCHMTISMAAAVYPAWESVVIRCAGGKIAECWSISDHAMLP